MSEIDDMLLAVDKIKAFLLQQKGNSAEISRQSIETVSPAATEEDFDKLKILLESDEWPAAVNPALIVGDTEASKIERAEGILDFVIDRSVVAKRFLDFGCGEGHVVKVAASMGAVKSIGYDIEVPDALPWKDLDENEQKEGYTLTTDFDKVRQGGPYDIILAYDSIEHADNMEAALGRIKSVASPHAAIYINFQPWIGRYGGVLYKEKNKAFVHAVFTEDELKQLGLTPKWKRKVMFPLGTYRELIKKAGFTILSERVEREPVEGFFERHGIIRNRLMNVMPEGQRNKFPRTQMEQCAVEFILTL